MQVDEITLPTSQFQESCLHLIDEVNAGRTEVSITKDGQAVARLVRVAPVAPKRYTPQELYGAMKGMATITDDIKAPLEETPQTNPVERLTPQELYGSMASRITIHGDVESPLDIEWNAEKSGEHSR